LTRHPLRTALRQLLAEARVKSPHARLCDVVDTILASPRTMPPLPALARKHSERIVERLRNPDAFTVDRVDGTIRLEQWLRWHAKVEQLVRGDGVELLDEIADTEPFDSPRFEALAERVAAALRALRALHLPWWQICGTDAETNGPLSIVDLCEKQLGAVETRVLRAENMGKREAIAW
jgi:hypothetical protein